MQIFSVYRRLSCALVFIALLNSLSPAQYSSPGGTTPQIVYQSPADGETYVPEQTTLIVRPRESLLSGRSPADFVFDVRGEQSGVHAGEVVLSDDNETVIFKPYMPFTLSEQVNVQFSISGLEGASPVRYSFRITSLSEAERTRRIQVFRMEEEQPRLTDFKQGFTASPGDTLPTPKYVVDTIVPGKVAPGDLYTTSNATDGFLQTLNNDASPLYEYQVFNPPCEEFRPWQNKYYSYIYSGKAFLLDSNHDLIDSYTCGNGYQTDDHEFQLLPNGHVLMMANDTRDTDMRAITGDSTSTTHGTVIGAIIQELDTKHNVVFQWRSWDHFLVQDVAHVDTKNPNIRTVDYCHLNSLELDNDGNIIASFREMDEVTKINRTNGKTIWRWGGKNNMFTFKGETVPFSYQHDVRRIPNGNVTMMDNGNYHTTTWGNGSVHDTSWSRAIEYQLDESSLTATPVWAYDKIDFTAAAGNVQRLPNGNTFILSGGLGSQRAIEVTPDGEKVYQLTFPIGSFTFRMFRLPTPPNGKASVPAIAKTASPQLLNLFPNPASGKVEISFNPGYPCDAEIDLIDVLGHTVIHKNEKIYSEGNYSVELDLRGLAAGVYYCNLSANGQTSIKMLLVR